MTAVQTSEPAADTSGGLEVRHALRERWARLRGGDLGPVPVILGLLVISLVFQAANDRFLSPQNLFNLSLQIASTGVIALGIVLVLVIGEIDLSVGSVSGVTSVSMVLLSVQQGWPTVPAIAIAVMGGALVGLLHGLVFSKLGVPSFVLTLGGLLTWQGAQLFLLRSEGTVNLPYDGGIAALANTTLPAWCGYVLAVAYLIGSVGSHARVSRRRRAFGLAQRPLAPAVAKTAVVAAVLVVTTVVFQQWRGIPLSLLIFGGLVVAVDVMLRHTTFGRRLLAVGGNAEAARRAGINVNAVKIAAFSLCSAFAAVGGVLAASRLFAVNQASGGSDVLLNAIAAAVIGGTSLFGGRGSAYSALLGMVVIGAVSNGMDLLNQTSAVKFMITGVVLVAAVVLDSLARRGRRASGR